MLPSVSHLATTWKSFTISIIQLYEKLDKIEFDIVEADVIPEEEEEK